MSTHNTPVLVRLSRSYADWAHKICLPLRLSEAAHGVESWRTATARTKPSAPARHLKKRGLLVGRLLDYGCGRGMDAEAFHMAAWDPYWQPDDAVLIPRRYHTITCSYVLNVVHEAVERIILEDVMKLLAQGGRAYFTVRRDITKRVYPTATTLQRPVHLNLPIVVETGKFCIYEKIRYP